MVFEKFANKIHGAKAMRLKNHFWWTVSNCLFACWMRFDREETSKKRSITSCLHGHRKILYEQTRVQNLTTVTNHMYVYFAIGNQNQTKPQPNARYIHVSAHIENYSPLKVNNCFNNLYSSETFISPKFHFFVLKLCAEEWICEHCADINMHDIQKLVSLWFRFTLKHTHFSPILVSDSKTYDSVWSALTLSFVFVVLFSLVLHLVSPFSIIYSFVRRRSAPSFCA